ncbi:MAG: BrnT family toxin [Candidatus Kapabacteria bacterium]|nr:BrnT family toxin [Candidatus Kapabacteria bacterium]
MSLIFDWDSDKNLSNISKHSIDFNDIPKVFENEMLIKKDLRQDYGEDRLIGLGILLDLVIVVVWTLRNNKIRIISARQANKNEREIYYDKIKN